MKTKLTTSISLPEDAATHWRKNSQTIMQFAERFLRIKMHSPIRRCVTRMYNHSEQSFVIVTTRFTPAEYDTLHYVAAALRVSVSSLVYGIIQLWIKPSRHVIRKFFATNYDWNSVKWDVEAGFLEENLSFWYINPEQPDTQLPFIRHTS